MIANPFNTVTSKLEVSMMALLLRSSVPITSFELAKSDAASMNDKVRRISSLLRLLRDQEGDAQRVR